MVAIDNGTLVLDGLDRAVMRMSYDEYFQAIVEAKWVGLLKERSR